MEDLKREFAPDPTMPQHREDNKPRLPEKVPIETDAGTIQLDDMKASYSSAVQRQQKQEMETSSPTETSELETMGFTQIERPGEDKHTRQALLQELLPVRMSSLPPPTVISSYSDIGADFHPISRPKSPPTESQDDSHVLRRKNSGNPAQESRLQLRIEEMQRRLQQTIARAEIAEEKAERAEAKILNMKDEINSSFSEVEKDTESLAGEMKRTVAENTTLKEQLRDAQSHIFSLQPYRKELTPEEVGRDYDDLIEGITDWVTKFVTPLLDDHVVGVEEITTIARKRPADAGRFKRAMQGYPDLVHGAMYPETDEDIVISIIMRYLHDNIFQKILYGSISNYVEVLSFVESAMQTSVEPKRDLFAIRTWTAEAYNAILSSPQFRGVRRDKLREMTIELGSLLRVFCKKEKYEWFFKNFEESCIRPAMSLYEKLQVSTHHFYLDMNPYIVWGHGGELETSTDFLDNLRNLDCKNILQNRKAFVLSKIDPPPTKKELYHHLQNVCTVAPALYMRQIGRKDAIKEPVLVRRQQMLVAWGPQEKREKFRENGDRPIINHIYYAKGTRDGSESWAPFRWG